MSRAQGIRGIIPPMITPMDDQENICEQEIRNQVNRLIQAGIHGIFPLGTNGENYILSKEEKEKVLSIVIDETKGRVPVYAGTGCISTKETIEVSKMAESLGADVLSVITPSFAAASQNEMLEHYKRIADSVKLPIVLYNIPARTGNALTPDTVEKLSYVDNIVGAKDSSGNFDTMLQYIEKTKNNDFAILSGNDSLILWNLLAGGQGGIAGCANIYPENMVSIYEFFQSGEIEKAKVAQDAIRTFRNCFKYGNPNTIVKMAVELLGYPVGKCRAPFCSLSEEGMEALKKVIQENQNIGLR